MLDLLLACLERFNKVATGHYLAGGKRASKCRSPTLTGGFLAAEAEHLLDTG